MKAFEELEENNELNDFKEWVQYSTTVIEVTNYKNNIVGVIIQNF